LIPSHPPLKRPNFLSASRVYCEQVGSYLQLGGRSGDRKDWYPFINKTKG